MSHSCIDSLGVLRRRNSPVTTVNDGLEQVATVRSGHERAQRELFFSTSTRAPRPCGPSARRPGANTRESATSGQAWLQAPIAKAQFAWAVMNSFTHIENHYNQARPHQGIAQAIPAADCHPRSAHIPSERFRRCGRIARV